VRLLMDGEDVGTYDTSENPDTVLYVPVEGDPEVGLHEFRVINVSPTGVGAMELRPIEVIRKRLSEDEVGAQGTPFWDDDDGEDASDTEPVVYKYQSVIDWQVLGLVAQTFVPEARILYETTLRNLRLTFRAREYGAIAEVWLDGALYGEVDTYSAAPNLVHYDLDAEALPPYDERVMSLAPLAFWKLDETEGTVIHDTSGNGFDGTAVNVELAGDVFYDGSPAAVFNGTNAYIELFSAPLTAAFPYAEGTILAWARVPTSEIWLDPLTRGIVEFFRSTGNRVLMWKQVQSGAGRLNSRFAGNNVLIGQQLQFQSTLEFFPVIIRWNVAEGTMNFWVHGEPVAEPATGIQAWNLTPLTVARIGANGSGFANLWQGSIKYVAIFPRALEDEEMRMLSRPLETHSLEIRHSGAANPNAVPIEGGYAVEVIRDYLGRESGFAPVSRINPDTGEFEVTYDGGATWTPSLENDPRNQYLFPPLAGDDVACRAASSVVRVMEDKFDAFFAQVSLGMGVIAAAWFLIALFATLATGGIAGLFFGSSLFVVAEFLSATILDTGVEVASNSLTNEVWDRLKCILRSFGDDGGRYTADDLQRIKAGVNAEIGAIPDTGGVAALVINLFLDFVGHGGLSNMAAQDAGDGADCDCLECPVEYFDPMTDALGWRSFLQQISTNPPPVWIPTGGITGGGSVEGVNIGGENGAQFAVVVDLGRDCQLSQITWHARKDGAATTFFSRITRVFTEAGSMVMNEQVQGNTNSIGWFQWHDTSGLPVGRYVWMIVQVGTGGGSGYLDDIFISTA